MQASVLKQGRRLQHLELQQTALNSKLASMSITINSFQEKNANAINDLRGGTNAFLTELISVVGQQYAKMQSEIKQSQAEQIKVDSHLPHHRALCVCKSYLYWLFYIGLFVLAWKCFTFLKHTCLQRFACNHMHRFMRKTSRQQALPCIAYS